MPFNLEALIGNPQFQLGLGLMGSSSPKNEPLLAAYQLLQQRAKAKQEAERHESQRKLEEERTRLYGSQIYLQERNIALQEGMQKFLQQYMGGGQQQAPQQMQPQQPQLGAPQAPAMPQPAQLEAPPQAVAPLPEPPTLAQPVIDPADQRAKDAETIRIMEAELRNPALTMTEKFGIQREIARIKATQTGTGFPTPSLIKRAPGSPERQAAQHRQFAQQPNVPSPGLTPEFSIGPGGISTTLRPNYEQQRIELEQTRIRQEQERIGLAEREASARAQDAATRAAAEARQAEKSTVELNTQFAKDKAAHSAVSTAADRMEQAANDLIKHPGLRSITGLSSVTNPLAVPGGPAYGALADLESLKAKIVNDTLQAIREAARNGASGYGQFTEKELEVVKNYVTSLDPGKPDFPKALQQVIDYARDIRQRSATLYEESTGKPAIEGLPTGARKIGTSGGKAVYQLPDGSRVVEK